MVADSEASILPTRALTIVKVKTLGQRVRELRTARRMTQQEVADRVGVTKSAITQLERGQIKGPRPEHLLAIAEALQVSLPELVHGRRPAPPQVSEPIPEASYYEAPEPAHRARPRVPVPPGYTGEPVALSLTEQALIDHLRSLGRSPAERDAAARRALVLLTALLTPAVSDERLVGWSAKRKQR
jgi:transcriptional regulator with XRE-family HTH domain